jgi:hypothetical protein
VALISAVAAVDIDVTSAPRRLVASNVATGNPIQQALEHWTKGQYQCGLPAMTDQATSSIFTLSG